jgi:hypothetical protein
MYTNVRMKLNARKRERQSVPNTIKVMSSNPARNEVYTIQLYLIKYVCNYPGLMDNVFSSHF